MSRSRPPARSFRPLLEVLEVRDCPSGASTPSSSAQQTQASFSTSASTSAQVSTQASTQDSTQASSQQQLAMLTAGSFISAGLFNGNVQEVTIGLALAQITAGGQSSAVVNQLNLSLVVGLAAGMGGVPNANT
jgi:hypothetical protein